MRSPAFSATRCDAGLTTLSCRIIDSACASEQENADAHAPQQYEQNAWHGHRHCDVGKAGVCLHDVGRQRGGAHDVFATVERPARRAHAPACPARSLRANETKPAAIKKPPRSCPKWVVTQYLSRANSAKCAGMVFLSCVTNTLPARAASANTSASGTPTSAAA